MFNEKKRLKLMSLIVMGSLLGGMYTSTNSIPAMAETGNASLVSVVNSTFESDDTTSWWGTGSAQIQKVTTGAQAGASCLEVTGRTAGYMGPQTDLTGKIEGGKTYTTSVWVKFNGTDGETKKFKVTLDSMIDGTQGYNQMTEQVDVPANTWTQITGTLALSGTVTKAKPYVECDDATTDFYIDDFNITTQGSENTSNDAVYSQSFETGLDGWGARGSAAVSQDSSNYQDGSNSLKISGRTKTWEGPIKDLTNILTKGQSYHFSAYVMYNDERGADSQAFNLQFENVTTGASASYQTAGSATAKKGEWTKIEGNYTIPADSDQYSLYIELPYKSDDKVTDSDKIDFYLDNLVITPTQIAKKDFQRDIPELKNVFKDYFPVGTCVSPQQIDGSDVHTDFIKYQYNALVPGNFMKPDALQPTEGNFHWDDADKYVEFGQKNGMTLRGHTLVWHNQIPDWFFQDPNDPTKPATSEQLRSRMENHIKTVVGRYKGKIKYWDVVNEVISDVSGLKGDSEGSKWKSIMGDIDGDGYDDDYIELAFKYAHEADPDATLIINDYGTEGSTRKRDDLYNLVERMLKKGIPVGGIGLQSHISMYSPSADQIKDCIEKFASLKKYNPNFTVQVTELDMSIYNSDSDAQKTVTDDILAQQASRYKEIFDVYKEEAKKGNLGLVMLWGNSDDDTWLDNFPVKNRLNAPMLFDRNLQAKPAYWAIVDPSKVSVYKQKVNVSQGTPTIGNDADPKWAMIKSFDVNSYVKGINGATAKVKTMWDTNNLYILADVKDETASDKDSVDIYLDNGQGGYTKYSINPNTNTDTVKVNKTTDGYEIQAKLPLSDIQAKLGSEIKFDMGINDYGSDGNMNSSVVWNDYTEDTLKPENGGVLVLGQESKLTEAKRGTPNIDGNIDEIWNNANVISTDVNVQGSNTAKAKVRTLWDKDYIYVLDEVTDSNLDKSSPNAYEQDSVETFIDENNARASAYDGDDAQYRVNYANDQSGAGSRITDKFKSATKTTDNGYIVEMAIPLHNEAVVNQIMGFDNQVNDAVGGKRVGINTWCDSTGQTWSTMSNVGNLLLVDTSAESNNSSNSTSGNTNSSNTNTNTNSSSSSTSNKHSSSTSSSSSSNSTDTSKESANQNTDASKNKQTVQNGWSTDGTGRWTFTEDGKKVVGWKAINDKWYLMDNNGQMLTGWHQDTKGKWYFLKDSGDMATGWVQDVNGSWYFLKDNGEMHTGWMQDVDGKWYFLSDSGEMLYDTTVDGYNLGADGAWIQ